MEISQLFNLEIHEFSIGITEGICNGLTRVNIDFLRKFKEVFEKKNEIPRVFKNIGEGPTEGIFKQFGIELRIQFLRGLSKKKIADRIIQSDYAKVTFQKKYLKKTSMEFLIKMRMEYP